MIKTRVIALLPRPVLEIEPVMARLWRANWFHLCLCFAANQVERDEFREFSLRNNIDVLMLVKNGPWDAREVASAVATDFECHSTTCGVVLLLDGPGCHGFDRDQRRTWNEQFAQESAALLRDIQVLEYDPSWALSPPRIR